MALGTGATIGYETTVGGGTYTTIAKARNIKAPKISYTESDAKHLGSTYSDKEAGLPNADNASAEILFDTGTVFEALFALKGIKRSWQITKSVTVSGTTTTTTITFDGWLNIGEVTFATDEQIVFPIEIVVTSLPTVA